MPSIANATSYSWTIPNGANIVSGANTNSITIDYSSSASSGSISLEGVNACGKGVISTQSITINSLPTANAGINQVICAGQSVPIGAASVTGSSYAWLPSIGLDFANISNPNANPIQTTTYSLTETNMSSGCFGVSQVTVVVHALPLPVIIQNTSSLQSSAGSSYQWFLNGNIIVGAIFQNYVPQQDGDYTVEISDSNACVGISSPYTFISTGSINSIYTNQYTIYPNPHTSSFVVSGKLISGERIKIRLLTMQDVEVKSISVPSGNEFQEVVNTEDLPAGIYILSVQSAYHSMLRKVVKIN